MILFGPNVMYNWTTFDSATVSQQLTPIPNQGVPKSSTSSLLQVCCIPFGRLLTAEIEPTMYTYFYGYISRDYTGSRYQIYNREWVEILYFFVDRRDFDAKHFKNKR